MKIPDLKSNGDEENQNNGRMEVTSNQHKEEKASFSFTPQQAHIFGGQSLFLSFANLDAPLSCEAFYYVTFQGSKLRHVTSAKILNPFTLQAVIPDHDQSEEVKLIVSQLRTDNTKQDLAEDLFTFTSDSSEFLAQQLVTNALIPETLKHLEDVYKSLLNVSLVEKRALDARLSLSFRHLTRNEPWCVANDDSDNTDDCWNLLHICAKYSLCQLAELLLTKAGSKVALQRMNDQGWTPLEIAAQTNHKRMIEILSRVPCDESTHPVTTSEVKRPSVKRHKLGTTTISNLASKTSEELEKDLMLLKEVDDLASATDNPAKMNGNSGHVNEEISPLSESLKKLQEINEEIRRLRSLSYKENVDQYEKEMNGETSPAPNNNNNEEYSPDSKNDDTQQEEDEEFLNIENSEETNANENEEQNASLNDKPSSNNENSSADEVIAEESVVKTENLEASEEAPLNEGLEEGVDAPEGSTERRLSCVSVEVVPDIVEQVEELEPVQEISVNEADDVTIDALHPPGNFKLESVTEETEEELKADGSGRSPQIRRHKLGDSLLNTNQTQSLTDLPPIPPKRVGILKRQNAKKDRPLSDSFENLKMVENQGILDLYNGQSITPSSPPSLNRGHSLDALMTDRPDGVSPSSSQISLTGERCDSQESLTASDCESPRSRSESERISLYSNRASSLSLNDVHMSRTSSTSSAEDFGKHSKKSSSLFSRFHGKKAKSMSALDVEEKNVIPEEERRKTIAMTADISLELGNMTGKGLGESDRLVRCVSYESEVKKSQSSISIDKLGKDLEKDKDLDRYRRVSTSALPQSYSLNSYHRHSGRYSDEDTDEGSEHLEKQTVRRVPSSEDKSKRRFGILTRSSKTKEKDKKSNKDKDKLRERKDSDSKKKKAPSTKLESSNKIDGKTASFLAKRGNSFRNFNKGSTDSFIRGVPTTSSVNRGNRQSQRSPVITRRPLTLDHMSEPSSDYDSYSMQQSKNLSSSRTSLDSLGMTLEGDDTDYNAYNHFNDSEYDSDLDAEDVPETWSELVDKKVQRKMHAKDIKRQDVIYELIQTEAQYVRTLNVMKKIYMNALVSLNFDDRTIHTIFPELEELIDLNGGFLKAMKQRQEESQNYCIESIGDILLEFFGGEKGERLKYAYGTFCSKHLEAVAKYKEIMKLDKNNVSKVMKKCLLMERSRRLTLPECITYVTIRMTKYPLLIEAIIKATKESKPDYEMLKTSLSLVKEVLVAVDDAVNDYEQQKELNNLRKNLDHKNVVEIKTGQTKTIYRAKNVFRSRSKLKCDKKTQLRGKSKLYETRMIVLADKIIFFQDNSGGKLQLLQVDNKAPELPLRNLMVRDVATDKQAIFLVSTSKDAAQIYEIVCENSKDQRQFMAKLKAYIKDCPEEDEETDNEEEAKREEEERMQKLKEMIENLQSADEKMLRTFTDKNRLVAEMRDLIECMDDSSIIKASSPMELKTNDIVSGREILEQCIIEVNQLSTTVSSPTDGPIQSPSPSPLTSGSNTIGASASRSQTVPNFTNINRSVSQRPALGRPSLNFTETDSAAVKRKPSQTTLLNVWKSKAMGSQEDLASISSHSTSMTSLTSTVSQMQICQTLQDRLDGLRDITTKQDTEVAKMRLELQESRNEIAKLRNEKKELEDRLVTQQKETDRSLRNEREQYYKLSREFKRTTDKMNRSLEEKKQQYQHLLETYSNRSNPEEVYL
ncbi:rho guanine nucleotide exchange factor 18-like isoform X3 [Clytia hemisphaerica]|uniref:rho guanine nucleotide exchange factor 18-like isoform X3 n=1 Tax=Clytia hemisphaerica TaxID=252671 RepID=UPI0034D55680